jgi:hypothetical protein
MQPRLIDLQLPRKPEGKKPIQLGAVSLAGRAPHISLAAFVVRFAAASMRCTLPAIPTVVALPAAAQSTPAPRPALPPKSLLERADATNSRCRGGSGDSPATAVALGALGIAIIGRAWLFRRRFRPTPAAQSRSRGASVDAGGVSLDAARTEPRWESRGGTALPAGPRPEPCNLLEQAEAAAGPLIVDGFRCHAAVAGDGMAPTAKTADARILEIYRHVGTAFQEVAKRRGEHLPTGVLNAAVLGFFQVEEMEGCLLDAQLAYELKLYEAHGLREVYRGADLRLF